MVMRGNKELTSVERTTGMESLAHRGVDMQAWNQPKQGTKQEEVIREKKES